MRVMERRKITLRSMEVGCDSDRPSSSLRDL